MGAQAIHSDLADRLRQRVDQLAQLGRTAGGGITRLAYTAAEREAHDLFAQWLAEDGYRCEVDAAGNSVGIVGDGRPYFLLGSHLDTVRDGGAYDGAAGVVAALEAARALHDDDLRRGVRLVAFAGEEGARFGRPNLGSAAAAGLLEAGAGPGLRDADGISVTSAADQLGLDPAATVPWLGPDVTCSIEIHIEQGRVLELGATRIGLVDAIAGSIRLRIDLTGSADHSGATPMRVRSDALAAASEIILAAERIGRRHRSTTVTVGRLDVLPNSVTTIPGRVSLWVDVRDVDPDQQRAAAASVGDEAQQIADTRGIGISTSVISQQRPVVLDTWLRVLAREECELLRIPYRVLASGAGHDAAIVAARAPAALIFIPCEGGISHTPAERARIEDLALAVQLTAGIVRRADALLG